MIDVKQFREQGYIYDSLENYSELIDFDAFKEVKKGIDAQGDIKRYSRYDYWFKYKDLSYMEELVYDELIKQDDNLSVADEVFAKGHEYQLKKIKESGFYPTWVFGTNLNDKVGHYFRNGVLREFEKKFAQIYYSDKNAKSFDHQFKLQFYDKGCEIKLHDDGQPADRLCVFLYFLNNEWPEENGGHLILYTKDNQSIKIKPVFPNFVVLDSDVNLFHEVEEVLNDVKYNIVCFFAKKN